MATVPVPHLRRIANRAYRVLHAVVLAAVLGVGALGALVMLSWQSCVAVLLVVGCFAASCSLAIAGDPETSLRQGHPWRAGMVGGGIAVATLGALELLGVAGGLVVLLAFLTSPRLWDGAARFRQRARVMSGTVPVAPLDEPPPRNLDDGSDSLDAPDSLTDEDLCLAWASSIRALRKADSVDSFIRIVEARRACLDELERSDPEGFSRWLASGARAASDPARFLTGAPAADEPAEPKRAGS
jgi:hypothetical protein